jgi:hypothetical protein
MIELAERMGEDIVSFERTVTFGSTAFKSARCKS